ncbi:MAG: hypothetical protein WCA35_14025 [Kovacikia sp.]
MSLNHIQSPIKIGFAGWLAVCVAMSGAFLTPQAAFGQDLKTQPKLEAVKQPETLSREQNFLGNSSPGGNLVPKPVNASQTSYLISPTQDELISNVLLAFLFLVLPAGVAFAVWMQERRDRDRTLTLNAQIQMLERIWKKSPQYPQH